MTLLNTLKDLANKVLARVLSEPAVILGVAVAAVNGATDQSWQGYGAAVLVALLRFFVSPVSDFRSSGKAQAPPARDGGFDRPDIKLPNS